MPEGFFRSEAAVVSDKAAIEILAGEKIPFGRGTIAASLRKKKPSGTQGTCSEATGEI